MIIIIVEKVKSITITIKQSNTSNLEKNKLWRWKKFCWNKVYWMRAVIPA